MTGQISSMAKISLAKQDIADESGVRTETEPFDSLGDPFENLRRRHRR